MPVLLVLFSIWSIFQKFPCQQNSSRFLVLPQDSFLLPIPFSYPFFYPNLSFFS